MKFKLVFFDCDGVILIGEFPWHRLHRAGGIPRGQAQKWWDAHYAGKLSHKQWIKNIQQTYIKNKLNDSLFRKTLNHYKINPEIYPLLDYLRGRKIKTAIISSGIDEYVRPVASKLGFDFWRSNYTFSFGKDGRIKKINYVGPDEEVKIIQVKEICRKFKIKPTETLFVGDSINDLQAFKLTKHGLLYKTKKNDVYEKYAWKVIKNLIEIKDILEE